MLLVESFVCKYTAKTGVLKLTPWMLSHSTPKRDKLYTITSVKKHCLQFKVVLFLRPVNGFFSIALCDNMVSVKTPKVLYLLVFFFKAVDTIGNYSK